jgi:hypothetical protein
MEHMHAHLHTCANIPEHWQVKFINSRKDEPLRTFKDSKAELLLNAEPLQKAVERGKTLPPQLTPPEGTFEEEVRVTLSYSTHDEVVIMFTVWKEGETVDEAGNKRKWGEWMRDRNTDPNPGSVRSVFLPREAAAAPGTRSRKSFGVSYMETPETLQKGTPFSGRSTVMAKSVGSSVLKSVGGNPAASRPDNNGSEVLSGAAQNDHVIAPGVIAFDVLPAELDCTFKVCHIAAEQFRLMSFACMHAYPHK